MASIEANFLTELGKSIELFKPEFALLITFVLAVILDIVFKKSKNITAVIGLAGLVVTGIFLWQQSATESLTFQGLAVIDPFGQFFKILILISTVIVILMSFQSKELYKDDRSVGEYYTLILGMTIGMFLLSGAVNLVLIYLAIETMSLSSYVLAGYTKEIKRSSEASLKYVIYGAISSGVMIYGISLLFGLTGSLNLLEINQFLMGNDVAVFPVVLAGVMIIAGIGYKISAVPFHFWTPDVYEGAPVTITAYLSVASKAAGFAILIRFLKSGFVDMSAVTDAGAWAVLANFDWQLLIAILSVLTMTLGNLVALWQTNVKRLLAYSSIAHAGYLLMGVVVMTELGIASVLIYFVMYMLMNLGAFLIVLMFANKIGSEEIDDYAGIGYQAPFLGACMVLFLISLTGLPPTAGFIGKLFIFTAVLKSDFIWLAVVGVLNSVVSLYYYVKIFRNMYLKGVDNPGEPMQFSFGGQLLVLALAIPTLVFGILYEPIAEWAKNSVSIFLGM